jgi:hypothetical protein
MRVTCRLACLLLALPVAMTATAAAGPETWDLKHHQGHRDKAVYHFGLSARAQVEGEAFAEAATTRGEMSLQMKCMAEYVGGTASGDQKIVGRILSGTLRVKAEGTDESLELPEAVFQYIVTPRGQLKKHELTSGEPPVLFFPGLSLVFGPEDAFMAGGMLVLPDHPVKVGDTWKGTILKPRPDGGEAQEIPFESALVGVEEFRGRRCVKIKTAVVAKLEHAAPIPGTPVTGHMESTLSAEGVCLFDPERGLVMSDEGSLDVVVHARADTADGETLTMDTSAVIRTRSALTEFNGEEIGGDPSGG